MSISRAPIVASAVNLQPPHGGGFASATRLEHILAALTSRRSEIQTQFPTALENGQRSPCNARKTKTSGKPIDSNLEGSDNV